MYERRVFERYLKADEERQLLRTVAQFGQVLARRDLQWMTLLRQTGIRVGSLARLTVGDALQALSGPPPHRLTLRADISKGHRGYQVLLTQKAQKALRALLKLRKEMGHPPVPAHPLIMSRNHRGISVRSLQDRMHKWVLAAGIGVEATPHWFRHTLAKRLIERSTANDPRAVVQHALGHRDSKSSAVYTFPDREELERSMEEAS